MTNGGVKCFSPDGKIQWEYFNGALRPAYLSEWSHRCPVIDSDLLIVRGVTSYWGKQGPARDRFYAFNKSTGARSGPALRCGPERQLILHAGSPMWMVGVCFTSAWDGNVACVDVRTGQALWRFQSLQGVNASVVIHDGVLVSIHGKENIGTAERRMIGLLQPSSAPGEAQTILKDKDLTALWDWELWRHPLPHQ